MKKSLLLGASAAAMLIATPALAQVELTISGGIEFEAGYANEDRDVGTDIDDFDFQTEAFITFTGQATADNGLTYGTRIDLDDIRTNTGVAVDEVSIFFEGGWGTLVLGDDDGAADNFETDPPTVGNGQVDGSSGDYIQTGQAISYGSLNTGDTTKVYYASPSFSGFQVGFSYTPENDSGNSILMENPEIQTNGAGAGAVDWEDIFEAGAKYSGDFGGFNVEASGTLGVGDGEGTLEDYFVWTVGVKGGTGPFEVGIQYFDNGDSLSTGAVGSTDDQWGVNVAGTYSVGAWGFGLGYSYAETDLNGGGQTEDQRGAIGVGYSVAPGLSVAADIVYFDQDAAGGNDNNGWVGITSVSASF
jgi:hypothetical protein